MANYTVREWSNGDIVTAVNLNHMEDGIANVDVGYSCSEGWVTLMDESVTTEIDTSGPVEVGTGFLAYDEFIDTDSIRVTFNGTEYTCQNFSSADVYHDYGASPGDWSNFPFFLRSRDSGDNYLMTETAGTYQVKIEAVGETVETSECFKKAVKSVGGGTEPLVLKTDHVEGDYTYLNMTFQEVYDAILNGKMVSIEWETDASNVAGFHYVESASPSQFTINASRNTGTYAQADSADGVLYIKYTPK